MLSSLQSINPFNISLQGKQQMFKEFIVVFLILFGIDFFFIKYFLGPIFADNIKNIQGSPMTVRYLPAAWAWFCYCFNSLFLYYFR